MNQSTILAAIQIIISILIITLILLQSPPEESGFSLSLSQPKFKRRGLEKLSFFATLIILTLFLLSSLLQLII